MPLRKPTLNEWFAAYQLRRISRNHSLVIGGTTIDVTRVTQDWEARGLKPSYAAILAKAAGLMGQRHPATNRLYLTTLWGDRFVEFEGVHINMPVRFQTDEGPILTAVCLKNADTRSALSLKDEIRDHVKAGLAGTQVTKLVASKPNTWFWRMALRVLWFAAWRVPLVEQHGGAITVSLPAAGAKSWHPARFTGPSPSSMMITLAGVTRTEGRTQLDIGITSDHLVLDGVQIREALQTLADILEGRGPGGVEALR